MKWLSIVMPLYAFVIAISSTVVLAEQNDRLLAHNPFNKPSILAAPKKEAGVKQLPEEGGSIEITATLVSDAMPMVIAAGELLSVGESIDGYRLVSVDEGKATFRKNGITYTFSLADSGVEIEQ